MGPILGADVQWGARFSPVARLCGAPFRLAGAVLPRCREPSLDRLPGRAGRAVLRCLKRPRLQTGLADEDGAKRARKAIVGPDTGI